MWSQDITYLLSSIRESFYLYLIEDIWSRRIVGFEVHAAESMEASAALIDKTCIQHDVDPEALVLQADNGGPIEGRRCSRPCASSKSRHRLTDGASATQPVQRGTLAAPEVLPAYPLEPFDTLEDAIAWSWAS